jgi:prevent-host-death family protein
MLDTNHKGNIAEAAVAFHAARNGLEVFRPVAEHGRYDIVLGVHGRLLRVQCKWAPRVGDVVAVRLRTSRRGPNGFVRTSYTLDEIDAVAAYCQETEECYLLPSSLVSERSQLNLRLGPPRNAQRAAIHYASDYRFGAVAQLGERRHGMAEARGSSPLSSTSRDAPDPTAPHGDSAPTHTIGAHELRERFGYWMERAAAGESVVVTRHGRPHVTLVAAVSAAAPTARAGAPARDGSADGAMLG